MCSTLALLGHAKIDNPSTANLNPCYQMALAPGSACLVADQSSKWTWLTSQAHPAHIPWPAPAAWHYCSFGTSVVIRTRVSETLPEPQGMYQARVGKRKPYSILQLLHYLFAMFLRHLKKVNRALSEFAGVTCTCEDFTDKTRVSGRLPLQFYRGILSSSPLDTRLVLLVWRRGAHEHNV